MGKSLVLLFTLFSVGLGLCRSAMPAGFESQKSFDLQTSVDDALNSKIVDDLLATISSSLSDNERDSFLVKYLEEQDVVDVMRMTGHGHGLDDVRLVEVFGEDAPRL